MKIILPVTLLLVAALLVGGCAETPSDTLEPTSKKSARSGGPDLKIVKTILHASYGDGVGGRVYVVRATELNAGTTISKPADMYVYQQMVSPLGPRLRYIRSFSRTTDLAPGSTWVSSPATTDSSYWIWIEGEFARGSGDGIVKLVFVADGPRRVTEIDETNNSWGPVTLPYRNLIP